jgi:hypothetical protein
MVELTFLFKDPPLSLLGYDSGVASVLRHAASLTRH